MADWYVYQHDGDYLGPWPTETVAHEIMTGQLAPDVWVAAPGGQRWLRALDVPVIARLIEGVPTRRTRRDSGLRLMPSFNSLGRKPKPADDVDSAAQTMKMPVVRLEDERPTDPGMPPITPTPTLESTGNKRRRRQG